VAKRSKTLRALITTSNDIEQVSVCLSVCLCVCLFCVCVCVCVFVCLSLSRSPAAPPPPAAPGTAGHHHILKRPHAGGREGLGGCHLRERQPR
jgi:hypothetical protein